MAEDVQEQDVVAVPTDQQGLRRLARRGPQLDQREEVALRIDAQEEHGDGAPGRIEDGGGDIDVHASGGLDADEVPHRGLPRAGHQRRQAPVLGVQLGHVWIEGQERAAVRRHDDRARVEVLTSHRLEAPARLGAQGGVARGLDEGGQVGAAECHSRAEGDVADAVVPPVEDLVCLQVADDPQLGEPRRVDRAGLALVDSVPDRPDQQRDHDDHAGSDDARAQGAVLHSHASKRLLAVPGTEGARN